MAHPAGAAAARPGGAGAPPRRVLAAWLSGGVAARAPGLERVVFPVRISEREPVLGDPAVEFMALAGPAGSDPGALGFSGARVYLAAEDSLGRAGRWLPRLSGQPRPFAVNPSVSWAEAGGNRASSREKQRSGVE